MIRVLALLLSLAFFPIFAQDAVLTDYEKKAGVSGSLTSVGSDTLAGIMTLWVEAFQRLYPSVNGQVQASGSSTAPPALVEQTAQFGPMSRRCEQEK